MVSASIEDVYRKRWRGNRRALKPRRACKKREGISHGMEIGDIKVLSVSRMLIAERQ